MGSLKRKLRRKQAQKKTKEAQKDMQEKLGLFDELSDQCLTCAEPFDKTLREQVQSWHVVVKGGTPNEPQKIVRLYCPDCWDKATKIIEEVKNDSRVQSAAIRQSSDESES